MDVVLLVCCWCCLLVLLFGAFILWRSVTAKARLSDRVQEWRAKGRTCSVQVRTATGVSEQEIFYIATPVHERRRVLLLVHGYPTSSFDWHRMWHPLLAYCEERGIGLVALDLLGFGFSSKPLSLPGLDDLGEQIHVQAGIIEKLLLHLCEGSKACDDGPLEVDFLCHDYGDTVGQELLHRFKRGECSIGLRMRSIAFLNGGMHPGAHRPVLMQKLLAAPIAGALLCRFLSRSTFGRSFAAVFGPLTRPSEAELDEHWAILCERNGWLVQPKLIKYMEQRRKHQARWTAVLSDSGGIPWCMLDGPADPVSGEHMAKAVADLACCSPARWRPQLAVNSLPFVQLLPEGIGHYPQLESPSATFKAYLHFQELVSGL